MFHTALNQEYLSPVDFCIYLWPTCHSLYLSLSFSLSLSLSLRQKCRSVFSLIMKTIMMKHAAWAPSPVIWVKHPLLLADFIVVEVCGKQIGDKCGHWDASLWNGAVMSIYLMSSLIECFLSVTHCTNTACATRMNFISTEKNVCPLANAQASKQTPLTSKTAFSHRSLGITD